jgi:hypothetical protein
MSNPTWDDTTAIEQEETPTWENTTGTREIGALEAAAHGAGQGATFGFSDEIVAGVKSTLGEKTYEEELADYQKTMEQAAEQNPVAFHGADIATSLVMPLGIAGKAASLGTKVLAGAATGGVETAGRMKEDILSLEGAEKIAFGAALGGGFSYALGKAGQKLKAGSEKVKSTKADDLRTESLYSGRKQQELEMTDKSALARKTDAVAMGDKLGVFKGFRPTHKNALKKTQKILEATGKKLKETEESLVNTWKANKIVAPGKFKDFGDLIQETENSLFERNLGMVSDKIDHLESIGVIETKHLSRAKKFLNQERESILKYLGKNRKYGETFTKIRERKSNLYTRIGEGAYATGVKPSWEKQVMQEIAKSLRQTELDVADIQRTVLKNNVPLFSKKSIKLLGDHRKTLEEYSKLRDLEEFLVKSTDRGGSLTSSIGDLKTDLLIGGAGAAAGISPLALPVVGVKYLISYFTSPNGKLARAKIAQALQGKNAAALEKIAKDLNTSRANLVAAIGAIAGGGE